MIAVLFLVGLNTCIPNPRNAVERPSRVGERIFGISTEDTIPLPPPPPPPPVPRQEEIFKQVEYMPRFLSCENLHKEERDSCSKRKLNEFLLENLKYPLQDSLLGIEGVVVVSFIVEKDGSVSTVEIVKGATDAMNAEAIRLMYLINEMGRRFSSPPARGQPYRVLLKQTIPFRVQH